MEEIEGVQHVDMGECLMVWKKQADGDYRIYMDMYRLLSFHTPQDVKSYPGVNGFIAAGAANFSAKGIAMARKSKLLAAA